MTAEDELFEATQARMRAIADRLFEAGVKPSVESAVALFNLAVIALANDYGVNAKSMAVYAEGVASEEPPRSSLVCVQDVDGQTFISLLKGEPCLRD